MSTEIEIHVKCYAGYRGEERPQSFVIGQRVVEVVEIVDQWYGPDYRYFKLIGNDNGVYILRHSEENGHWQLTVFDSGDRDEERLSST